jgi:hypothetical protein
MAEPSQRFGLGGDSLTLSFGKIGRNVYPAFCV